MMQAASVGGSAVNAVKQKREQFQAAPPSLALAEKQAISMQSAQSFELPDTERIDRDEAMDKLAHASQSRYLYENNPDDEEYEYLLDEVPETSVGEGVDIKGELQFTRLLRIDGTFEGRVDSMDGSVVVGKSGCLVGDVKGMDTLIIDGGKMIGDVQVERLVIRGTGYLKGALAAKTVCIGQHCTVIGRANVHSLAPEVVDSSGDIVVDEPELDIDPLSDPEFEDEDYLYGEGDEEGGGEGEEGDHDEAEAEAEAEGEGGKEKSGKKSKKSKKNKSGKGGGGDGEEEEEAAAATGGGEPEPEPEAEAAAGQ
jgi:cytoskeletal protein CcmA (bactofilin family)